MYKRQLYESASNNRGQHGSFGSTDVHNMLLAYGPNFKKGMTNNLPSGNVDVAPTVAHILGFSLPQADGRVLREALVGDNGPTSVRSASVTSQAASGLTLLTVTDLDGKEVTSTNGTYNITLQTKSLSQGGKNYTYFDSALATRK